MKASMNDRTKMLFEHNEPPPEKNQVDTYKFASKSSNKSIENLPKVDSNADSLILNTNTSSNSNSQKISPEIKEWNNLWKNLVDQMTQVTDFPPFLIQTPEDQRKSLIILTQKVCDIAQNPVNSAQYQSLLKQYEAKENQVNELQEANLQLKEEIENLKNSYKEDLKHFSQRIQEMENYALQIEHYTEQIDKRKELSQTISQISNSNKVIHPVAQEQNNEKEKEKNQSTAPKSTSAPKVKSTKKPHKQKNRKQSPKKNAVSFDSDKYDSEPTPKKEFKIEENQRFEEDYISKLIQKYTKPNESHKSKSPSNYQGKTLFERSVTKPVEKQNDNISPPSSPKQSKKRAWH